MENLDRVGRYQGQEWLVPRFAIWRVVMFHNRIAGAFGSDAVLPAPSAVPTGFTPCPAALALSPVAQQLCALAFAAATASSPPAPPTRWRGLINLECWN